MEMTQYKHVSQKCTTRKNAEIVELEKKYEKKLKARLQKLELLIEEEKSLHPRGVFHQSVIADIEKKIISNQLISAEKSIAELEIHFRPPQLYFCIVMMEYRNPKILVLGGCNSNKTHLLDRDRTRWSTFSLNLPTFLYCGGAVYLYGEIYIFGGWNLDKKTYKLNREMKWIQLAAMNEERTNIDNSSVGFNGCIWVFGGWNNSENIQLNSVEKYIPEENKWIQMPSMKEKREYAAAAACRGKLFVSGGYNGVMHLISMECFDPASQKWTMFLDLPTPTFGHAMISDGSCLTVLGGYTEEKSVWKINPNEGKASWKRLPQMRESRYRFTVNLLGNKIFAIGGNKNETKVEFFNGETWEYGPELPEEIKGMHSIVIPEATNQINIPCLSSP